jgi:hypothetical protein
MGVGEAQAFLRGDERALGVNHEGDGEADARYEVGKQV